MNKQIQKNVYISIVVMLGLALAGPIIQDASALVTFDSGSICASAPADPNCLGNYNPPVNDVIIIPPSGILQYSTFTVPRGVTVTFQKNANNTPVTVLVSGDVTIYGIIALSGTPATCSGTACDGNLGDDAQPGVGGPGGFDGGYGGYAALFGGVNFQAGGAGKGPGGGQTASNTCGSYYTSGGGGGFGSAGSAGYSYCTGWNISGGATYGQAGLLPLIGGSGGGGGAAGAVYSGAGGGGGGGAIMIASSGTIFIGVNNWQPASSCYVSNGTCNGIFGGSWGSFGRIYADGGSGGSDYGDGAGGGGGGGSGGAIRLVANTITRGDEGYLETVGGGAGGAGYGNAGSGGNGLIRLEANTVNWSGNTNPGYSFGLPGHVFVPNGPTLIITSVTPTTGTAVPVPANPTGNADITFPAGTTSATVSLAATNIPVGTTVTVYAVPASGATRSSALSGALAGTDASSTASATVTLSPGNNVLMAAATYTVTEIIAMNLPTFDNGIRVAKVRVESTMGGESKVTYITASGKEYSADSPLRDKPGKMKKAVEKEKKA